MVAVSGMLHHLDALPDDLLASPAERLLEKLDGPTLISLEGKNPLPLFISVLLHGNEHSGWNGLRRFLSTSGALARSTTIFIGNLQAAAADRRTLPGQQDYNRIWRGADEPEATLVREVRAVIDARPWFAAIDLHNNTGHNPHYAVLTDVSAQNLGLARLFSDQAVLVEEPDTVLTRAFDGLCPAVTLELGPIADDQSDERCRDYLERCFALDKIPAARQEDLTLYRALARVHVAERAAAAFRFADGSDATARVPESDSSLVLTGGVEGVNFHRLPAGFEFGSGGGELGDMLTVLDVDHRDVTHEYLELVDGKIRLSRSVTPAMYTIDPIVVRQDCLCYFMEPITGA